MNNQERDLLSKQIIDFSKKNGISIKDAEIAINTVSQLSKEQLQSIGKCIDKESQSELEKLIKSMK